MSDHTDPTDRPCRCVQCWCAICGAQLDAATWIHHLCEPTGPGAGGTVITTADQQHAGSIEPRPLARPLRPAAVSVHRKGGLLAALRALLREVLR